MACGETSIGVDVCVDVFVWMCVSVSVGVDGVGVALDWYVRWSVSNEG